MAVEGFNVKQFWTVANNPRLMADLTGTGCYSIVGFGEEGTWMAINDGFGGFLPGQFFAGFGFTDGWRVGDHPRFAVPVNGTRTADLVGFGEDSVWVAFNDGFGNFLNAAQRVCPGLCHNTGWGAEQPRFVTRLTQNNRADLLGFGNDGVWVALNNGDNTFNAVFAFPHFGFNSGWRIERHLRFAVDLTGKGQADLIGFYDDDVYVAINDGTGNFGPFLAANVNNFCYDQGWRVETHPRFLADVTGNGLPDIVGFGNDGVWVALNNGDGTFAPSKFMLKDFGSQSMTGISTVFVLMMENRSFDHMLGLSEITGTDAVTGEPTAIEGVTTSVCNHPDGTTCPPVPANDDPNNPADPNAVQVQSGPSDRMPVDPGHNFLDTLAQLAGTPWTPGQVYPTPDNSGFVQQYKEELARQLPRVPENVGEIMRCFAPGELPVLQQLAKEFVVCDNWFSSMPGPTWPNRLFVHAASSGGLDDTIHPGEVADVLFQDLGDLTFGFKFHNGTIYDRLKRAKLGYIVYGEDQLGSDALAFASTLPVINTNVRLLGDWGTSGYIGDAFPAFNNFIQDLGSSYFNGVRYVHIEPYYDLLDDFAFGASQHPRSSVATGELFIKMVYEAIRNSPIWGSSLLIITWDEHGGFFDHVPPPVAVPPGDVPVSSFLNKNGFRFDRLGVRVPAIVISPLIPKNLIDKRQYDHTSVLATLEELFGLDPLTDRDSNANSVTTLLTLPTPRSDTPATLVSTKTLPHRRSGRPVESTSTTISDAAAAVLPCFLVQDLRISSPAERAAIVERVKGIKTNADAAAYMKEVQQKLLPTRSEPPTTKASKSKKRPRKA
jgi:phospholipase C